MAIGIMFLGLYKVDKTLVITTKWENAGETEEIPLS